MPIKMRFFSAVVVSITLLLSGCSNQPNPQESKEQAGQECFTLGKKIEIDKASFLECRYQKSGDLIYVALTGDTSSPLISKGLNSIETCKLTDQRPPGGFGGSGGSQNTGFPLSNTVMPSSGDFNIGVIPIDFSDSPATKTVDELMSSHLKDVDDWLDFTTDGVTEYTWHMPEEWLRMPLESSFYKFGKQNIASDGSYVTVEEQLQTTEDMTTQIFSAAEAHMNLDEIDYFWIVMPPTTKNVDWTVNGTHQPVLTPSGIHHLTFYSLANVLWNQQTQQAPMYGILLHEMLHAHGAAQHAPGNEYAMHIGNSIGSVMGAWDSFLLAWRPDESFACIDSQSLKEIEIPLTPLDHKEKGYKAAFVKLSDHELIVIESRRKGPFSHKWIEGAAFVTSYVVDTSKPSNRYDGDNSRVKDYFSYYLEIQEPHIEWMNLGQPLANMNGPDAENFSVRHVAFQGDIFEYGGIQIEVIEQADTDTVRISKGN